MNWSKLLSTMKYPQMFDNDIYLLLVHLPVLGPPIYRNKKTPVTEMDHIAHSPPLTAPRY
jgi:hypothetical protein